MDINQNDILNKGCNKNLPRVLIIGAGPSGILCIKHLINKADILCFEAKSDIGGVWNYSEKTDDEIQGIENNIFYQNYNAFSSSMYDGLQLDQPQCLMTFKGFPFTKDYPEFLGHLQFQEYLQEYCQKFSIKNYIKFNTYVEKVSLTKNLNQENLATIQAENKYQNNKFLIKICDMQNSSQKKFFFVDFVLSCIGHYTSPSIPQVIGLNDWDGQYYHSKQFRQRKLEQIQDKTIVLIGSNNSGIDLLQYIIQCQKYQCKKLYFILGQSDVFTKFVEKKNEEWKKQFFETGKLEFKKKKLKETKKNKTVIFDDGEEIQNVDLIIFATGYEYRFPFLEESDQLLLPYNESKTCWGPLYLKMFSINEPSLIFLGQMFFVLGIQQFLEKQAILCSRIIQGISKLPTHQEMLQSFEEDLFHAKNLREDLSLFFKSNYLNPKANQAFYDKQMQLLSGIEEDENYQEIIYKIYIPQFIQTVMEGKIGEYRKIQFRQQIGEKYCPDPNKF